MKTFKQFKQELGVETIQFLKSKETGRQFATIKDTKIIVASNLNPKEALFVNFNEELGINVLINANGVDIGMEL